MTAASKKFFTDDVMYEPCEASKCNVDQRSFKAYFTRSLAATAILAPYTHDNIIKEIQTSANAAVKTCKNGPSTSQCGLRWTLSDNTPVLQGIDQLGVGEQMAVLEIIQSNLVDKAPAFASATAGTGTSEGDPSAGLGKVGEDDDAEQEKLYTIIGTGDKVGAGVLTALVLLGVIAGSATMIMSE